MAQNGLEFDGAKDFIYVMTSRKVRNKESMKYLNCISVLDSWSRIKSSLVYNGYTSSVPVLDSKKHSCSMQCQLQEVLSSFPNMVDQAFYDMQKNLIKT